MPNDGSYSSGSMLLASLLLNLNPTYIYIYIYVYHVFEGAAD